MGKRKNKDCDGHRRKKIRRLKERLRRYERSSSSEMSEEGYRRRRDYSESPLRLYSRSGSSNISYISDSDDEQMQSLKSVVGAISTSNIENTDKNAGSIGNETQLVSTPVISTGTTPAAPMPGTSTATPIDPVIAPSTSTGAETATATETLPDEVLEALGDPKGKDEVFGPKIPEEISKRWGRILVDGLTKEQKQEMSEKTLIPDNFRLAKAPLLNPEIVPILGEAVRNRDKLLEKAQNHLGLGIAGLTNLTSTVIRGETNKIEILKKISEISQFFLDLHHENTKTRRKLVISSLDKKFTNIIKDAKRDSFLFGDKLGDKIKACKTAERSGLHIKRSEGAASSSKKYSHSGNWRGPPRSQGQRSHRQGGQRNRNFNQTNRRRTVPSTDRQPASAAKANAKPSKA